MTIDPTRVTRVTIVTTRYGGTYEGGKWAAFPESADTLPGEDDFEPAVYEWQGTDPDLETWWDEHRDHIGLGATPQAALDDLAAKLEDGRTAPHFFSRRQEGEPDG